jgi:hypothetical protein
MSTRKPGKKKVVVTTRKPSEASKSKRTPARAGRKSVESAPQELLFGKRHYIFMGIGVGLILLGLLLMSGGHMPSPDVWDEGIIYGFRRTVLAPFLILAGLVVEIYAIFFHPSEPTSEEEA